MGSQIWVCNKENYFVHVILTQWCLRTRVIVMVKVQYLYNCEILQELRFLKRLGFGNVSL